MAAGGCGVAEPKAAHWERLAEVGLGRQGLGTVVPRQHHAVPASLEVQRRDVVGEG